MALSAHPLAVFILARMDALSQARGWRLSFYDVADRSKGLVSKSTVWRLTTAAYRGGALSVDTITGLAAALDVDPSEIVALTDHSVRWPYVPPREADRLDEAQRKLVDALIKALARDEGPT